MTNLLPNPDWTRGISTLPGRNNMRVPANWYFAFTEGLDPRLPDQDPASPWLAPEMTFRSADGLTHGQTPTERLPDNEHTLYLAADAQVVYHVFKGWGIQWWRLGINANHQALTYRFSIELFNDVYYSDGRSIDPRSMEWRIRLGSDAALPEFASSTAGFRRWNTAERTFDHPGGVLDVSIEVRARWGIDTVGAFFRRPSLVALNASPGGDPVPAPPNPAAAKLADIERRLLALSAQSMVTSNDVEAIRQQIQSLEFAAAALREILDA